MILFCLFSLNDLMINASGMVSETHIDFNKDGIRISSDAESKKNGLLSWHGCASCTLLCVRGLDSILHRLGIDCSTSSAFCSLGGYCPRDIDPSSYWYPWLSFRNR